MAKRPKFDGEDNYIAAVLELYQRKNGVYNDIVEIDYYGGYVKHFNTYQNLGVSSEPK